MRQPVRVCFMIDGLAVAGTESQLVATINRLDRRVVKPYLCLLKDDPKTPIVAELHDCPVLRLGMKKLLHVSSPARVRELLRFLRQHRITILQLYFPDSTYVGVLAGKLAGLKRIIRVQNNLGYWMNGLHRTLHSITNRLVDRILVNCGACRTAMTRTGRVSPAKVEVIPNGIDLTPFASIPLQRQTDGMFRIGMVANLRPVKDVDTLIAAAQRVLQKHPHVVFEVAGEGNLRPALERQIAHAGMQERFLLVGAVRNIPGFLAKLDLAVLCSRSEGMSNALLEYMAAGRPIVATAVGGNRELIEPELNGLLVPPGNPVALAQAIERLIDQPWFAAQLGATARRHAEQRYSREANLHRVESFFVRLTHQPRRFA